MKPIQTLSSPLFCVLALLLAIGIASAQPCPPGWVSIGGVASCAPCPVDTFQENNVTCAPCATGEYSDAASISCTVVPRRVEKATFVKKMIDSVGVSDDNFGTSVALEGPVLAIGVPFDDEIGQNSGTMFIWERTVTSGVGTWAQKAKLYPSDGAAGDNFGWSVGISGDYIAASAPYDDDKGLSSGSVYMYKRQADGGWLGVDKLVASDGAANDRFGFVVAMSGHVMVIAAPYADSVADGSGSIYIYEYNNDTDVWSSVVKKSASDGAQGDAFGYSVAIEGNTIVAGAYLHNAKFVDDGAAYVFSRTPGTGDWTETAKLTASDKTLYDQFGQAVAVFGPVIAVGTPGWGSNAGAVYMFEYSTATSQWTERQILVQPSVNLYGSAVAASPLGVLVGAPLATPQGLTDQGAAYMYRKNSTTGAWQQDAMLLPVEAEDVDPIAEAKFGFFVAMDGIQLAVSAPFSDAHGAVYLYGCGCASYMMGSVCSGCPAGMMTSTLGALSPEQPCQECSAGVPPAPDMCSCAGCEPGQFSPSAAASCKDCGFGTFSSTAAATSCSPCASGRVADLGAPLCDPCAAGTYANTLKSDCIGCFAGQFSSVVAATSIDVCTLCPVGTVATSLGSSVCRDCPAGRFQSEAHLPCLACQAGFYSEAKSTQCSPCPLGQYNTAGGSSSCLACPAGSFASGTGSFICKQCPSGAYCPAQAKMPLDCPPGEFNDQAGMGACNQCPFPDRCLGRDVCQPGYAGALCDVCADNHFFNNGKCEACPVFPISYVVAGVVLVLALVLFLSSDISPIAMTNVKIVISFVQTFALTVSVAIFWPPIIEWVRSILSALYLGIDNAGTECLVAAGSWHIRFWVVLAVGAGVPLLIALAIAVVVLLLRFEDAWERFYSLANLRLKLIRLLVIVLMMTFVPLTKLAVEAFACIDSPNGRVLAQDTLILCDSADHASVQVIAAIVLALIVGVGPFLLCYGVIYDVFIKSSGSVRNAYELLAHRTMYAAVYESYRPGMEFFEVVVLIRKVAFAAIIGASPIPLLQAVLLVVLGIGYFFAVLFLQPFALVPVLPSKRARHDVKIHNYLEMLSALVVVVSGILALGGALVPISEDVSIQTVLGYAVAALGVIGFVLLVFPWVWKRQPQLAGAADIDVDALGYAEPENLLGPMYGLWLKELAKIRHGVLNDTTLTLDVKLALSGAATIWFERFYGRYETLVVYLQMFGSEDEPWFPERVDLDFDIRLLRFPKERAMLARQLKEEGHEIALTDIKIEEEKKKGKDLDEKEKELLEALGTEPGEGEEGSEGDNKEMLEARKWTVAGPGLKKGKCGNELSFDIHKGKWLGEGKDIDSLKVVILDPAGVALPVKVVPKTTTFGRSTGLIKVSYTPKDPGMHRIQIALGQHLIGPAGKQPWKAKIKISAEMAKRLAQEAQDRVPEEAVDLLEGHTDSVGALTVHNGWLFSGSNDKIIGAWDLESLECEHILEGHSKWVEAMIGFGNRLFSASTDRTIRVWDLDTFESVGVLKGHADAVYCLAIHGNRLFSGSEDCSIRVWDLESLQCTNILDGHTDPVRALAVHGNRVLSASEDTTIRAWNVDTMLCVNTMQKHTDVVRCLVVHENTLFSGSYDETVRVWDLETMSCTKALEAHQDVVRALAVSGGRLFTGSYDKTIKLWNANTLKTIQTLKGHTGAVWSLTIHKGRMFSGSVDQTIRVWDIGSAGASGGSGSTVNILAADMPTPAAAIKEEKAKAEPKQDKQAKKGTKGKGKDKEPAEEAEEPEVFVPESLRPPTAEEIEARKQKEKEEAEAAAQSEAERLKREEEEKERERLAEEERIKQAKAKRRHSLQAQREARQEQQERARLAEMKRKEEEERKEKERKRAEAHARTVQREREETLKKAEAEERRKKHAEERRRKAEEKRRAEEEEQAKLDALIGMEKQRLAKKRQEEAEAYAKKRAAADKKRKEEESKYEQPKPSAGAVFAASATGVKAVRKARKMKAPSADDADIF